MGSSDLHVGISDLYVGSNDLQVGSSDLQVGSSDLYVGSSDLQVGSSDLHVQIVNCTCVSVSDWYMWGLVICCIHKLHGQTYKSGFLLNNTMSRYV